MGNWSYDPYKWSYGIILLVTGRDPTLQQVVEFINQMLRVQKPPLQIVPIDILDDLNPRRILAMWQQFLEVSQILLVAGFNPVEKY